MQALFSESWMAIWRCAALHKDTSEAAGGFRPRWCKACSDAEALILASDFQVGPEEAFLAAAVVTRAFVFHAEHTSRLHQAGNAVGQRDFSAHTRLCLAQVLEN